MHMWESHVTHTDASFSLRCCVTSHLKTSHLTHIHDWDMSHTHVIESCHTRAHDWVMLHTHIVKSCHTHTWLSHVTHTYNWVMSHTHIIKSCHTHTWLSHVTHTYNHVLLTHTYNHVVHDMTRLVMSCSLARHDCMCVWRDSIMCVCDMVMSFSLNLRGIEWSYT